MAPLALRIQATANLRIQSFGRGSASHSIWHLRVHQTVAVVMRHDRQVTPLNMYLHCSANLQVKRVR